MLRKGWILFAACWIFAAPGALFAQAEAPQEAREVAESWLALLAAEEFAASWQEAASTFQSAVTEEQWTAQAAAVRAQVGEVENRELAGSEAMTNPPGAPPGDYLQLRYRSTFQLAGEAMETVALVQDGERGWRVVGYFVQPAG
jgi:hypothetical protein